MAIIRLEGLSVFGHHGARPYEGVPCALIIGRRKESTDKKTSLNEALREYGVPV